MNTRSSLTASLGAVAAAAALLPATLAAQPAEGPWHYRASLYLYLPSLDASTSHAGSGGGSIGIDGSRITKHFDSTFMGSFEAHNGRWGVFTDFMYLDFANERQASRDFTINGGAIPVGTSARLGWDLGGSAWTLAGEYRVKADPALHVDLFGGFRMLRVEDSLSWDIAGSLGSLPPASRSGRAEQSATFWDAVAGVKGRFYLDGGKRWSVPFYADIGTGESKLTWQVGTGIGYSFSWGDINLLYRHLAYEMKSGKSSLQDASLSGPMLGAAFKF